MRVDAGPWIRRQDKSKDIVGDAEKRMDDEDNVAATRKTLRTLKYWNPKDLESTWRTRTGRARW